MGARSGKLVCSVAAALMAMPVFVAGGLAQTAQTPAAEPTTTPAPAIPASPETTPKQAKPKSPNDPALDTINPTRFGKGPEDDAFGAYQRGLYKTAYNLALPRAEAGDPNAQVLLAEILARGLGVPINMQESANWYGKAADQGLPEAQFRYAVILLQGKYAPKNPKRAKDLMKAAADAGNGWWSTRGVPGRNGRPPRQLASHGRGGPSPTPRDHHQPAPGATNTRGAGRRGVSTLAT